jgi:hypothetical protein
MLIFSECKNASIRVVEDEPQALHHANAEEKQEIPKPMSLDAIIKPDTIMELAAAFPESVMDFVIPVKEVGPVLRAVVEGVVNNYLPRTIVFVAENNVLDRISWLLPGWCMRGIHTRLVSEETLFAPLGLSREDIKEEWEASKRRRLPTFCVEDVQEREFGWWYQQLIKLGAGTLIPDISETYVVWDSDLIQTRRWPILCPNDNGIFVPTVALLQDASKHPMIFNQYAKAMEELLVMAPMHPSGGGTFIAHHMPMNRNVVQEMLRDMRFGGEDSSAPWPLRIVRVTEKTLRFSEYLTYATFAIQHPSKTALTYHPYDHYGQGGERIRGGGQTLDELLESTSLPAVPKGGFSYPHVMEYVSERYGSMPYLQLDHVYSTMDESVYGEGRLHSSLVSSESGSPATASGKPADSSLGPVAASCSPCEVPSAFLNAVRYLLEQGDTSEFHNVDTGIHEGLPVRRLDALTVCVRVGAVPVAKSPSSDGDSNLGPALSVVERQVACTEHTHCGEGRGK